MAVELSAVKEVVADAPNVQKEDVRLRTRRRGGRAPLQLTSFDVLLLRGLAKYELDRFFECQRGRRFNEALQSSREAMPIGLRWAFSVVVARRLQGVLDS